MSAISSNAIRRPKPTKQISLPPSSFTLNTTNPEALELAHANIRITVLGGVAISGLERLKVTLKISNADNHYHPVRQHLDLYHAEQVQRLVQWCGNRLDIDSTLMEQALQQLTSELENYRLQRLGNLSPAVKESPLLTSAEKEEALNYLRDENLMQNTFDDLGKTGIVGEEENRMIMFLVFLSRILPEPLHIISFGASGSGKTYLQEKIAQLIPTEHKIEITAFSANALYYFKSEELQHKILLIEDMDGAQEVLYPLRELQSKQKLNKVISIKDSKGEIKKQSYTAQGAVCVAGCTTKESIYEDNANRSLLIHIDGSEEQDQRIIEYQQKLSAQLINFAEEEKWQKLFLHIQRMIVAKTVRNPYATYLQLPSSVFKQRRTNALYLKFIEVITIYNQSRESKKAKAIQSPSTDGSQKEENVIETSIEDIEWANKLLKHVLLKKSDELSGASRGFLERLKKYLEENGESTFKARELRMAMRISSSTLNRHLMELTSAGYLRICGGNKTYGYCYGINNPKEYKELHDTMQNELSKTLDKLRKHEAIM